MKKFLCLLVAAMLLVPFAFSEETNSLPQPDEKGRTTYVGEVGWLFDENGNFIKESLFDEAVLWIEDIPGVHDVNIIVENGKKYSEINVVIVVSHSIDIANAKDIADSALRSIGSLFGMTSEYEGPTKDSLGTVFDDYYSLVGVFTKSGKLICLGATTSSRAHITWR